MRFETMLGRVIDDLRGRVRNGETTERALARILGLSQPHMHNLLKGVRRLNADMGDHILARLGMSVVDLIEPRELARKLQFSEAPLRAFTDLPVLRGRLGPGHPMPEVASRLERAAVPASELAGVHHPVVAHVASDSSMRPLLSAGEMVVLDTSESARLSFDPDSLFAVEWKNEGAIRWVRYTRRRLYLVTLETRDRPAEWDWVPAGDGGLLEIVKARVIRVTALNPANSASPKRQLHDTYPGPVRRCVPS